jgi:hypothetical protein
MASNNPYAQQTITKISEAEVSLSLTRAQALLTTLSIRGGFNRAYAMKDQEFNKRLLLYLYNYYLDTWDFELNAYNYTTATQMASALSTLEQLLFDTSCDADIDYSNSVSVQFNPIPTLSIIKVPFPISFVVTAAEAGSTQYFNEQLKNLYGLYTIFVMDTTFQVLDKFTLNSITGILNFQTLTNTYTLQPGDRITGEGYKYQ